MTSKLQAPSHKLGAETRAFDVPGAVLMVVCCVAWGASLGMARLGIEGGLPPLTLVSTRAVLAAMLLVAMLALSGRPVLPPAGLVGSLAVLGLFQTAAPFALTFLAMAQPGLPSGAAMVILCTQPFWVAILGRLYLRDEPLTRRRVAGLLLGFAGVVAIAAERLQGGVDELLLPGMMLAAALSWTVGTILARRIGRRIDAWRLTTWQLIFATGPLVGLALLLERGASLHWTVESVGALIYLTLVATVLTMLVWFLLLARHGAARLTPFVFLQPVAAVLLGVALGEPLTAAMLVGTALVGTGIVWVNRQ